MSTTSTSSSGITFAGISSGIDTTSIISKMMAVEAEPITTWTNQESTLSNLQTIYGQLSSYLTSFSTAAQALNTSNAFAQETATSSNTATATISSTSGAQSGTYSLTVNQLAQAQKLASSAQSSTTSALSLSGEVAINGKAFQVSTSDTLTTIASKINSLSAGVTASVLNGGTGNSYLTLTAQSSGAANQIQIADVSGGVMGSLGVLTGTASVRQAVTNGAESYGFSSSSSTFASMMGGSISGSGSIAINGTNVSVDLSTDSLQSVASKINAAGISGVSAAVISSTDSSNNVTYQLSITGSSSTPTFTDSGNVLASIGVLQQSAGSELIKAQDAKYSLDSVNLTSSSNTITSAIQGVTLNLLAGTPSNPATSTLSLTTNTTAIDNTVNNFVSAYNTITSYISQNSTFDSSTYDTGPLFGDAVAQQVQNSLSTALFSNVTGLSGTYTNLASVGFSLDSSGNLSVDTSTFNAALAANPTAVQNLFESTGSATNSAVSYVSSGTSTLATGTGYAVNITQAATQTSVKAATQLTGTTTSAETLTFGGTIFSGSSYLFSIDAGSTLDQIVSKINGDSKLKNLVTASNSNGSLEIQSVKYGSTSGFTVYSSLDTAGGGSGIGTSGQSTLTTGVDVAGTINGETASGVGQYLTGASGNKNTDGLQIRYTGTTTGSMGTVSVSNGMGNMISRLMGTFTNSTNGAVTTASDAITTQITNIKKEITDLNTKIANDTTRLQQTFANMESAISAAQSQESQLSSITNASSSG